MGVERTDYLIVGWKLNIDLYDELRDDALLDSEHCVYDAMSGKYLIFGKIIARAGQPEGFQFTEIKPEALVLMNNDVNKFKDMFKELTGRLLMECVETDTVPKAMLFSHFW